MFLHYLVNLKITIATDLNGILHTRHQNSSCKILGHLNSSDLNPMTTTSAEGCSNAQKGIQDVSKVKQWVIDV